MMWRYFDALVVSLVILMIYLIIKTFYKGEEKK